MSRFTGEYEVRLDDKNRLRLPAVLLRQLGEEVKLGLVINRGFDKCLVLYPQKQWEKISDEVNQLNLYVTANREFARYFFRGATPLEPDASSRILMPKTLMEYAGIQQDVIIYAYGDQIEIWAKEAYERMMDSAPKDFATLAEKILGHKDV
ncbi:MAG: division/cell wall cluster transcriptional repressor MraZ [Saprospiraceae bacterium]|nr:division/cell wall cluster transcriptional repressor MraZ [Saprospiraceae bacterium]HMW40531.1 division/cell wall cluster transcriptional repressor MraZ [Saprospiraceae bacterium]HMX89247.1 division/cell wall cluster transcriptional repressor MraZ [Saprospiraceae bacterium]HMZ41164.1 division/cell wall cluster transcriptional repressor MraZ [Saprospiraceae bacterium]HNA65064.1 division/cell wall cluster transcriptional repressor MraZ [Saprospiraceae bacterium]